MDRSRRRFIFAAGFCSALNFNTVNSDHDWGRNHSALAECMVGNSRRHGFFATERTLGAVERLEEAKEILQAHGNYEWLTENGSIEFAATYSIILLVLFFIGGGRYISVDYWISRSLS